MIQTENGVEQKCGDIHLYGIYQAERFGGKYIYFCSLSLMHWVSPLIADGVVKGGLVCGPVLAYNPEDFLTERFGKKYMYTEAQRNSLKSPVHSLSYIDPSRVNSLSELLFITSAFLSDMNYSIVEQGRTIEQQSEINSYIQYIKTMECKPEHRQRYPMTPTIST